MRRPLAAASTVMLLLAACGSSTGAATERAATTSSPTAATGETGVAAGRVGLQPVGRFTQPVYVTAPRGQGRRVFVVEQPGVIRVVRGGRIVARPFLDLRSRVTAGGEQGLLGLAFARDYAASGRFYVYFTGRDQRQWVVEYRRASADRADPGSARTLLRMADPEPNHNGGALQVGRDGMLYIGTGDGGGAGDQHGKRGNAQDLGSLLGKILRIDPHAGGGHPYRIPPGNPFAGTAGRRGEIWDYGLRNPWRWSFDRATGALTIGDVGQDTVEEVDFRPAGQTGGVNFGWRAIEGDRRFTGEPAPGAVAPVITHRHDDGWCSITGGYVVRDRRVPALAGRYLYGDFCKGLLMSARLRPGGATDDRPVGLPRVPQLSSFGEDGLGRVYVVSLDGPVYRLVQR